MTTLAADTPRSKVVGDINEIPVIAADIIYEGAAVGVVIGTGHARPLEATDKFVGFAVEKCDNSAGAAAAKNVRVKARGAVQLTITGAAFLAAAITDVGVPVFAADDNVFQFSPISGVYIGRVRRYVSSGLCEVEYDALLGEDPYLKYGSPADYELLIDDKTLDIEDNGKVFFMSIAAKTVTLPAIATPVHCTIVNLGGYGDLLLKVAPDANDMIHAPDLAGTNNKAHQNTAATAQRGDLITIEPGDADGWVVSHQVGTWAQEG